MVQSTDLATEMQVQQDWQLRPEMSHLQWFKQLVAMEFAPLEQQLALVQQQLSRLVRFAAVTVPYYRDLLTQVNLTPADLQTVTDLTQLPMLTKQDLLEQGQRLQADCLPPGEQLYGVFKSSGTTGRPTQVLMTTTSNLMFSVLLQRQYRVLRFDPRAKLARILWASDLPRLPDGTPNPDGATLSRPRWRYLGQFFETGPEVSFNRSNPIAEQLAWLRSQQPDYLVAYAGMLEFLAHAQQGSSEALTSLKAMMAISEQLTPAMRKRIEDTFAAPVQQNYGLNEIGVVAVRCPAGRYHVHIEHCWVEIVDAEGNPCAPGETGQVVVTGLKNFAMPLLRYNTGDLAVAVAGSCACGRTLPSFGDIIGRYRRYAYLPENSMAYFQSLLKAFADMPIELSANLRHFQLHQYRDHRFELRYLTAGPLPPAFFKFLHRAWQQVKGEPSWPLSFQEMPRLVQRGRKLEVFTSDFAPTAETPDLIN